MRAPSAAVTRMLIVRRRQGESILIGGDIEIEIIELGPVRVKVGVHAPSHITVHRKEVALVRERNVAAAALAPDIRDAIAQRLCPENDPQVIPRAADESFEARYSGHPEDRRTRARQDAGMYP